MLKRAFGLYRCATTSYTIPKEQKARIKQKMQNDRIHFWKKYRTGIANFKGKPLDNLKVNKDDYVYLQKSEIQTRIMKRLYSTQLVDLTKFEFKQDLRNDLHLDSLNVVIILTEIEHQFTTVFEDRVFESVRNLGQLVEILGRDHQVF